MTPTKFGCFLFVLLSTALLSLAHSTIDDNAATELIAGTSSKVLLGEVKAATASTNILGIRGRKMAIANVMKPEKKNEHDAVGGTSMISSSNEVAGKCGSEENYGSNFECEKSFSHFSEGVDEAGVIAFNADYHAPRHHPPKNN
ncbi:hypothetical protein SO802_011157 [Lithocarpus litseifolius]|uniref:Uncharacterized protein n=1 Tax=Lithocarpus litseifolius TaxID=425828 RepID=A0AAW2CZT4_9ROSI